MVTAVAVLQAALRVMMTAVVAGKAMAAKATTNALTKGKASQGTGATTAGNGGTANAAGPEGSGDAGAQQLAPSKSILGGLGNILSQTISSVTSRCVA